MIVAAVKQEEMKVPRIVPQVKADPSLFFFICVLIRHIYIIKTGFKLESHADHHYGPHSKISLYLHNYNCTLRYIGANVIKIRIA